MSVIIKLLSKFDNSGIRAAQKGFSGLGKTLGAVGIGFGLKAVTTELAQATKNAQADVISQKQLARQLKITSNATDEQIAKQEDYITKLSMTTGVVDDELRPSFGVLLRATGSVSKAQELLNVSLDTSAGTGKNLETVTKSIARAYGGNVTGLQKLVPGIKKGTDAMGFLKDQFAGARETLANPFDQLTIAIDETKEKIGMALLPTVQTFAKYIIDEVIPKVDKFLDDVSNPKTEAGKTFVQIKDAIAETVGAVKEFFGYFGDGDAVKGFGNVVAGLIKALPALLALKGIFMLASAGKSIANLAKAIGLMTGASAVDTVVGAGGKGGKGKMPLLGTGALLGLGMVLSLSGDSMNNSPQTPEEIRAWKIQDKKNKAAALKNYGKIPGLPQQNVTNNITINAPNVDPKVIVDGMGKYIKTNGTLPFSLSKVGR